MARLHSTVLFASDHGVEGIEKYADKQKRVKNELKQVGVTAYGLNKFNSRFLPKIIHDDEHIQAVVYGRYKEGSGLLYYTDRMVVATDRRVISLNHKPGYTDVDEFTYDIIDGVEVSQAWPFAAVTLNTKVAHFTLSYAKIKCAELFMHYIEKRRLEYYQSRLTPSSSHAN